ncbi:MAG: dUTP diphosphatase [Alphaproteobacteria bacterium]|nr:dUTP diphosphatase [Alphaproteobacteria bacterium]
MALSIELKILDPRLPGWGFPHYGSALAAGLDLHACLGEPLNLRPQAPPALISAGIAIRIGSLEWCALILPRSGLGHRNGLVLGNLVGVIDPDYEGACLISAWNRNPPDAADSDIVIRPGDRIAQLVFTRIERPQFAIVPAFSQNEIRQDRGFGSTGIAAADPGGDAGRAAQSGERREHSPADAR